MDIAAASAGADFNLTGEGEATRVFGAPVSANLFSVLGAPAARGRTFQTREDASLPYGVTATDPLTLLAVTALVLGVAITATAFPAWRAARIDPVQSLHVE